jgi:hypothetical protein
MVLRKRPGAPPRLPGSGSENFMNHVASTNRLIFPPCLGILISEWSLPRWAPSALLGRHRLIGICMYGARTSSRNDPPSLIAVPLCDNKGKNRSAAWIEFAVDHLALPRVTFVMIIAALSRRLWRRRFGHFGKRC